MSRFIPMIVREKEIYWLDGAVSIEDIYDFFGLDSQQVPVEFYPSDKTLIDDVDTYELFVDGKRPGWLDQARENDIRFLAEGIVKKAILSVPRKLARDGYIIMHAPVKRVVSATVVHIMSGLRELKTQFESCVLNEGYSATIGGELHFLETAIRRWEFFDCWLDMPLFRSCTMQTPVFRETSMPLADWRTTQVNCGKFESVTMRGNRFAFCEFYHVKFDTVDFSESTFCHCLFSRCQFDNCNLSKAQFCCSTVESCLFKECERGGLSVCSSTQGIEGYKAPCTLWE